MAAFACAALPAAAADQVARDQVAGHQAAARSAPQDQVAAQAPGQPPAQAAPADRTGVPQPAAAGWYAAWGTALMAPAAKYLLPERADVTLRQVMRLSAGGTRVRVRFSNAQGDAPLVIAAAGLAPARAGSDGIDGAAARTLRFAGKEGVTIAPGGEALSDPVDFAAAAGQDVAVSLHLAAQPARQSVHQAAHATQYVAAGNQAAQPRLANARQVESWYHVTGIEVASNEVAGIGAGSVGIGSIGAANIEGAGGTPPVPVLVAAGDSLTDGSGAGLDANERWTDWLARRNAAEGRPALAIVNAGIGGNSMLRDDIGPNLLARFERDVLQRPGVAHAVVLIGVNDLGRLHKGTKETPATRQDLVQRLQAGWRQMAQRAHARGICFVAGTLMPYGASKLYQPEPHNEADRLALNDWLRQADFVDAVADFDAAVRDPAAPDKLLPTYDSGDHLHLSPAGYRAMAQAVPLDRLAACGRARAQARAAAAAAPAP